MEFTFKKFAAGYSVHLYGMYVGAVTKESGGWAGYLPGETSHATWRTGGAARQHAAESLAHKSGRFDGELGVLVGLVDGDYNMKI